MEQQKTIKRPISIEGIGLHTGEKVKLKFKPADVNTGINFIRTDISKKPAIKAHISNVVELSKSPRRTSLGSGQFEVQTVEHLMAALAGLGIDNISIEIDSEELPGLDGSASPFLDVLKKSGLAEQDSPRKYFYVKEPVWIEEGAAVLILLPCREFEISYTLSYNGTGLKTQHVEVNLDRQDFSKDLAPARTFCLEKEADDLIKQGLGKGADYENTLVVGKNGVIKNKLRLESEFARHKILDLIGDLYLLGMPFKGHVIAIRSGHPLNLKLLKKMHAQMERLQIGGIKSEYTPSSNGELDINLIKKVIPHRYPFLLVDRILELVEDRRAVGIKNVTINDNFFQGHFPERPVMPGVLVIEAMAQVAGVLMLSKKENLGKLAYFIGVDNARFRKTVVPGDQLRIDVEVIRLKSKICQVHTNAYVDDKIAAEADLMFTLVEA